MRAFWWFEENKIAGFARPGFNCTHWFDFPFEEGIIMSWLGQFNSGSHPFSDLKRHLKVYLPKVAPFYKIQKTIEEINEEFLDTYRLNEVLEKVMKRTQIISSFQVTDNEVQIKYCDDRLQEEVKYLKSCGVEKIVSLTEHHLNAEKLEGHFDLHHFSIVDMEAPSVKQAEELASIIAKMRDSQKALGIHCMAGIGRTTTMLVAAHLILGSTMEEMKAHVKLKKPEFQFLGSQAQFLDEIEKQYRK